MIQYKSDDTKMNNACEGTGFYVISVKYKGIWLSKETLKVFSHFYISNRRQKIQNNIDSGI